jgi:hypothetical protein
LHPFHFLFAKVSFVDRIFFIEEPHEYFILRGSLSFHKHLVGNLLWLLIKLYISRYVLQWHKTSHNRSTISSVIHIMLTKIWCGTTFNEESGESGIIGRYRIIARKTKKFHSKYIMYIYLHWDSTKY